MKLKRSGKTKSTKPESDVTVDGAYQLLGTGEWGISVLWKDEHPVAVYPIERSRRLRRSAYVSGYDIGGNEVLLDEDPEKGLLLSKEDSQTLLGKLVL